MLHQGGGDLERVLNDPITECDEFTSFLEALAYPNNAGVACDLQLESPSLAASFRARDHQTNQQPQNSASAVEEVVRLRQGPSASQKPERASTHDGSYADSVQCSTGAAQPLVNLPKAEDTRMEKRRAKNRRNQRAFRERSKVCLCPVQCA
jgi:hypothetical protein